MGIGYTNVLLGLSIADRSLDRRPVENEAQERNDGCSGATRISNTLASAPELLYCKAVEELPSTRSCDCVVDC